MFEVYNTFPRNNFCWPAVDCCRLFDREDMPYAIDRSSVIGSEISGGLYSHRSQNQSLLSRCWLRSGFVMEQNCGILIMKFLNKQVD